MLNNIAYLKTRYILVQIEKTRDCDLDLVVGEVRESGLQEICNKTLEKVEFKRQNLLDQIFTWRISGNNKVPFLVKLFMEDHFQKTSL